LTPEALAEAFSHAPTPRVISLLPAATEIVTMLGAESMVVGITHECDYPAHIARTRPHVTGTPISATLTTSAWSPGSAAAIDAQVRELAHQGASLFHLDVGRITSLAPTVFLTQALCDVCAVDERDVRSIAASLQPPPTVVTLDGTTVEGVFRDIQTVANALGLSSDGEELVDGLRVRLRRVRERLASANAAADAGAGVAGQPTRPLPRVAVVEWSEPVYAAGHWVPELVAYAGGVDVLAEPGKHSTVRAVEEIAAAKPDVLFIAPCGYSVAQAADEAADLLAHPEWAWARQLPVWALDANGLMTRPGPRIVDGVETLASALYPEVFGPPNPSKAKRII